MGGDIYTANGRVLANATSITVNEVVDVASNDQVDVPALVRDTYAISSDSSGVIRSHVWDKDSGDGMPKGGAEGELLEVRVLPNYSSTAKVSFTGSGGNAANVVLTVTGGKIAKRIVQCLKWFRGIRISQQRQSMLRVLLYQRQFHA